MVGLIDWLIDIRSSSLKSHQHTSEALLSSHISTHPNNIFYILLFVIRGNNNNTV